MKRKTVNAARKRVRKLHPGQQGLKRECELRGGALGRGDSPGVRVRKLHPGQQGLKRGPRRRRRSSPDADVARPCSEATSRTTGIETNRYVVHFVHRNEYGVRKLHPGQQGLKHLAPELPAHDPLGSEATSRTTGIETTSRWRAPGPSARRSEATSRTTGIETRRSGRPVGPHCRWFGSYIQDNRD